MTLFKQKYKDKITYLKHDINVFVTWFKGFVKVPFRDYKSYALRQNFRIQKYKANGQTLKDVAASQKVRTERCNHRKGGDGLAAISGGRGDTNEFAVIKHKFANGDIWVNCLRCNKKWKPGSEGYAEALMFPTRNKTSAGVQFGWSDGGAHYREAIKNS